ncbi:uncharacterized protein LOC126972145 [Leptidea sinapis]|uniref:uncharacterized protein LOC126972145 n=1 Tax=Leptidea sinapis TaxID=189913 RepID=UPI0021C2B301|nr:uncharacterized protein LOC126972145 [Leptidea sinapis]
MKLSGLFVLIMAVLSIFVGSNEAAPKISGSAIKKGGKVIRKGFGIASAAGTAHEVYEHIKNRRH